MGTSGVEITRLLAAWGEGDKTALDALVPLVHKELRRLAHRYMRQERPAAAFQTTELVNEVYLKLVDCSRVQWHDRAHFFAISAQLMRRILVDFARSRRYAKRGGEAIRVTFEKALESPGACPPDWVALDDALVALEALDARKCRMVELRFFGGLSVEETAEVLQVSPNTILRDWRFAKSWLRRELTRGQEP
jgi:RNA polymerase sigma factor (TIGR02999 family)